MTEQEYVCSTNRAKVTIALNVMRDVLPGDGYGIGSDVHKKIIFELEKAESRLFASVEKAVK